MLNSLDIEGRPQDTRVVVAMSGGVDSSVTAALLKSEGYDVVGITLQLYDHGAATHRKGACCAGQDIHDARNVAERIGIPHYVLDYENRFREAVIDNFADSYVAGETPVPCVECNQSIKFRDLLATARELGAEVLATGHYVASRALPGGGARAVIAPRDAERDQSYFLFATTREQLDYLRFPLGDMTKAETRELARRFGLAVADKHDSQDICFVPTGRYTDMIERLRPGAVEPGDIVDLDGRVLGRHQGIIHFTVGQRRGLGIAAGAPLYVVRLDAATRRVVVGPREALRMDRIALRDVNWIGDGALDARGRRAASRCSCGCARPGAPQPAWLRARRRRMRSSWSPARRACRPARPACSTMRPRARRACSAAASSRARPRSAVAAKAPLRQPISPAAMRGIVITVVGAGAWRQISTARGSQRLMGAGRRSTIWCSARCSITAAIRPSRRPTGSAAGFSTSASAPDCRCRTIRARPAIMRRRYFRADAAQGAGARARARACQCRDARGDGRQESRPSRMRPSTRWWRNMSSPRCRIPEATLDDFIRVLKPGGETHPGQSYRRRSGPAPRLRTGVRAAGAPARLAAGISVGAAGAWAARHGGVRLAERRPMPPMGHFSLIRFARTSRFAGDLAPAGAAR